MEPTTTNLKPLHIAVVDTANIRLSAFYEKALELSSPSFAPYDIRWSEVVECEDLIRIHPDVIIQLVDSTDLDESMVFTPQLIDMHCKLVIALDRYDELLATHHSLDYANLAQLMGVQIAPINAATGEGIASIIQMAIDAYEGKANTSRHIHVAYGTDIEEAITTLRDKMAKEHSPLSFPASRRYLAIRLLERPETALELLQGHQQYNALKHTAEQLRQSLRNELGTEPAYLIHEARHGFVHGALEKTLTHSNDNSDHSLLEKIDAVLTHRLTGFPILIVLLYLIFQCTFAVGSVPQRWIADGVGFLCDWASRLIPEGWFSSLLIDGVLQGVGAVVSFLPNIIILFFFISLLEDSGYMARAAYLMDGIMHKVGLHGRSFIPMLVGFGCNVPAIMSARNITNRKDRTLTMLMIPFMSCSARLPVYMLLAGAFFPKHAALVMISLYLIGILLSIIFALVMKRTRYFRKPQEDFVSELPKFRRPTLRNTATHIWERVADYLKKISTVILYASIIIWALEYFPRNEALLQPYDAQIAAARSNGSADNALTVEQLTLKRDALQKEHSYLAAVGKWMTPVTKPLGFDWKMNVCILTGLPAKEAIVSTMGILYRAPVEGASPNSTATLQETLRANKVFTPLSAFAFMLFVLLYFPCIATVATLKREIGTRWAVFTVLHSLLLAWVVAFIVFQTGCLLQ